MTKERRRQQLAARKQKIVRLGKTGIVLVVVAGLVGWTALLVR